MGIQQRSEPSRQKGGRVQLGGSATPIVEWFRMSLFTVLLLATVAMAFRVHMVLGLLELAAVVASLLFTVRTARVATVAPRRIR